MKNIKSFKVFESTESDSELSYGPGLVIRDAIKNGDFAEFKRLVNKLTNDSKLLGDYTHKDIDRVLFWTCGKGTSEFVEYLLDKFEYTQSGIEYALKSVKSARPKFISEEGREAIIDLLKNY
jgi:hypothetical protein